MVEETVEVRSYGGAVSTYVPKSQANATVKRLSGQGQGRTYIQDSSGNRFSSVEELDDKQKYDEWMRTQYRPDTDYGQYMGEQYKRHFGDDAYSQVMQERSRNLSSGQTERETQTPQLASAARRNPSASGALGMPARGDTDRESFLNFANWAKAEGQAQAPPKYSIESKQIGYATPSNAEEDRQSKALLSQMDALGISPSGQAFKDFANRAGYPQATEAGVERARSGQSAETPLISVRATDLTTGEVLFSDTATSKEDADSLLVQAKSSVEKRSAEERLSAITKAVGSPVEEKSVGGLSFFLPKGSNTEISGMDLISTKESPSGISLRMDTFTEKGYESTYVPISGDMSVIQGVGAFPSETLRSGNVRIPVSNIATPGMAVSEANKAFEAGRESFLFNEENKEAIQKAFAQKVYEKRSVGDYDWSQEYYDVSVNVTGMLAGKEYTREVTQRIPRAEYYDLVSEGKGMGFYSEAFNMPAGKIVASIQGVPVVGDIVKGFYKTQTYADIQRSNPLRTEYYVPIVTEVLNAGETAFTAYSVGILGGSAITAGASLAVPAAAQVAGGIYLKQGVVSSVGTGAKYVAESVGKFGWEALTYPVAGRTVQMAGASVVSMVPKIWKARGVSGKLAGAGLNLIRAGKGIETLETGLYAGANLEIAGYTLSRMAGSKKTIDEYGSGIGAARAYGFASTPKAFVSGSEADRKRELESFTLFNLPYYGIQAVSSAVGSGIRRSALTTAYAGLNVFAVSTLTARFSQETGNMGKGFLAATANVGLYDVYAESFGPDIAFQQAPVVGAKARSVRESALIRSRKLGKSKYDFLRTSDIELKTRKGSKKDVKEDVKEPMFSTRMEQRLAKIDIRQTPRSDMKTDMTSRSDMKFDSRLDNKQDIRTDNRLDTRLSERSEIRTDIRTDYKMDYKPPDIKIDIKDDPKYDVGRLDAGPWDVPFVPLFPPFGGAGGKGSKGKANKGIEGKLTGILGALEYQRSVSPRSQFSIRKPDTPKLQSPSLKRKKI